MTAPIVSPTAHVIRPRTARCRVRPGLSRVGLRPVVPVQYGPAHDDRLILVRARTEDPLAEFRGAVIDTPTFVLNGIGRIGWTCSVDHPALDQMTVAKRNGSGVLKLIGREVQWWRDGVLRFAGVPTSAQVSIGGTVSFEAPDLGYYLSRRFFGGAERRDLLNGAGSFDRHGLPGWTRSGVTAVRDTSRKARGVGSAHLSGSGTLSYSFTMDTIDVGEDQAVRLTGVVWLPAGTEPGVEIARLTVRGLAGGAIVDRQSATVDQDTKTGGWFRFDFYATVPTGGPHYITVDLVSLGVHGDTWFDDVRTLRNDTTGFGANVSKDLTTHAVAALNEWQTQGTWNLHPRKGSPSAAVEPMGVRHVEHTQATDWLQTQTDRRDGIDWWIDPATREIWFARRRGVDHKRLVLHNKNVHAGSWSHDESGLTSKQVVIGDGDGVDRPEGGKTDTSRTAGILLDDAYRPANGTPLSALDPLAEALLDEHSQPQVSAGVRVSADLLGTVGPGDRVSSDLYTGRLRLPTKQQLRIGTVAVDLPADELVLT